LNETVGDVVMLSSGWVLLESVDVSVDF